MMNGKVLALGVTVIIIGLIMLAPVIVVDLFESVTGLEDVTGQAVAEPQANGSIMGIIYAIIAIGFGIVVISFFFSPRKPMH